jgi:hypothetical protein
MAVTVAQLARLFAAAPWSAAGLAVASIEALATMLGRVRGGGTLGRRRRRHIINRHMVGGGRFEAGSNKFLLQHTY